MSVSRQIDAIDEAIRKLQQAKAQIERADDYRKSDCECGDVEEAACKSMRAAIEHIESVAGELSCQAVA